MGKKCIFVWGKKCVMFVRVSVNKFTWFIPGLYHIYHDTMPIPISSSVSLQADLKGRSGAVSLDLELLKQYRVSAVDTDAIERSGAQDQLEYASCKFYPMLQFLPTKLAEWIGENMQDKLGFLDRQDPAKWNVVSELNDILHKRVVPDRNQIPGLGVRVVWRSDEGLLSCQTVGFIA